MAAGDSDFEIGFGRQRGVKALKPHEIMVAGHPQFGKTQVGLYQVTVKRERSAILGCCFGYIAKYAVSFAEREMESGTLIIGTPFLVDSASLAICVWKFDI